MLVSLTAKTGKRVVVNTSNIRYAYVIESGARSSTRIVFDKEHVLSVEESPERIRDLEKALS